MGSPAVRELLQVLLEPIFGNLHFHWQNKTSARDHLNTYHIARFQANTYNRSISSRKLVSVAGGLCRIAYEQLKSLARLVDLSSEILPQMHRTVQRFHHLRQTISPIVVIPEFFPSQSKKCGTKSLRQG